MFGCCLCAAFWIFGIIAVWFGAAYLVNKSKARKRDALMIVLGSGGHTGEMLYMMLKYDFSKFKKVYCIVGDNDTLSVNTMKNFIQKHKMNIDESIIEPLIVPRPRKNGEGVKDSLYHQINSLLGCVKVFMKLREVDSVLSNGPGLCLSVFGAYYVLALFMMQKLPKMFYIESFCRTKSLSASGKILYHLRMMDDFFVMWPKPAELYPRTKYVGFTI